MVEQLHELCFRFTNAMDAFKVSHEGRCYSFGHILSEGLSRAGFKAKRTSGHFLIRDKFGISVVYGDNKFDGIYIGDFHCWCVLEYKGEKIIIDASLKYNKKWLINYGVEPHEELLDTYIGTEANSWLITYIEDESNDYITQECIDETDPYFLELLINIINKDSLELLKSDSSKSI